MECSDPDITASCATARRSLKNDFEGYTSTGWNFCAYSIGASCKSVLRSQERSTMERPGTFDVEAPTFDRRPKTLNAAVRRHRDRLKSWTAVKRRSTNDVLSCRTASGITTSPYGATTSPFRDCQLRLGSKMPTTLNILRLLIPV